MYSLNPLAESYFGKFHSVVRTEHVCQIIVCKLAKLCAYIVKLHLHSQARFRHVSVRATTIIREDTTTDQKHRHCNASYLLRTPRHISHHHPPPPSYCQLRPCLRHTSHVCRPTGKL
jgi:hypothetical protein